MSLLREKPNAHNRRVLTTGETMRVRRKRLGWGVYEAAKKARIGKDALLNIEKDRNYTSEKLDRYKAALEEAERAADLTSPVTSSSTDRSADVQAAVRKERQRFRAYLVQIETTALTTLEDARARIAALDAEEDSSEQRRRG
jgi:hypothetical protein